ncbi:hypothetical protein CCMA1212_010866 [Trichoderma ghanense]|uniref:BZIP domain-containing protein n=1 Tax=Trichoderma ghanense TaxID=65468 RepID=A0ABY2GNN1_9HYPO
MERPGAPNFKPQSRTGGSVERRRLQNRRAQHSYRLREAAKAKQDKCIITPALMQHGRFVPSQPPRSVAEPRLPCGAHFASAHNSILSADHRLLTLVHNNIIRGLIANANLFSYSWNTICQDDSLSSFCGGKSPSQLALPASLQPTDLQQRELHHPWLDLIPFPRFRDNVLRKLAFSTEWDETELCEDLTGAGRLQLSCSRPGFMVWGEDSWDARNWEVTEEFAHKWHGVLDGCWGLVVSSNAWRKKRGEAQLCINPLTTTSSSRLSA